MQPEGRGEEGEAPERPVELQKKRESPPATINEPAKVNVERRRCECVCVIIAGMGRSTLVLVLNYFQTFSTCTCTYT